MPSLLRRDRSDGFSASGPGGQVVDHGYGDGEVEGRARVREVQDVGYEGRVRLVGFRDACEVCGSIGFLKGGGRRDDVRKMGLSCCFIENMMTGN
ncbi:hypothetical protein KC356_g65 [Hortaea werneckii]|nr:hypothetical protein KC356_g65 [Hortaea werneckii]